MLSPYSQPHVVYPIPSTPDALAEAPNSFCFKPLPQNLQLLLQLCPFPEDASARAAPAAERTEAHASALAEVAKFWASEKPRILLASAGPCRTGLPVWDSGWRVSQWKLLSVQALCTMKRPTTGFEACR